MALTVKNSLNESLSPGVSEAFMMNSSSAQVGGICATGTILTLFLLSGPVAATIGGIAMAAVFSATKPAHTN